MNTKKRFICRKMMKIGKSVGLAHNMVNKIPNAAI
jgi:hypothetical protein